MTDNPTDGNQKAVALFVTTLSSFLTPFMASAMNIGLPSVGKEFNMSAVALSWVATSYLLATAVLLVPFGKVADIYGRKKIFTFGMFIYTVSSLMCGIAGSSFQLISYRILQGVGSAMIFTTAIAILTSIYPLGERGKALGINVSTTYLGLSLGPFLGGILTQHMGWRSIFLVNVPLGIILILVVIFKLKGEWAESRGEKLDLTGSVMFILMLICIMYGFTLLPGTRGIGLIAAGMLGFIVFVRWENRIPNPVLNMILFRTNTVFTFSSLAALINYSATSAIAFLLSLYLQNIKALSPQSAGLVLVSQPIMMAIVSPFAGKLSDKIEPRVIASAGMTIIVAGLIILFFLSPTTSIAYITLGLVLLGLGFGLFSSPNTNAIMSSVEKRYYGIASATLSTMRLTGQMLSMAIAILVFSLYIGKVQINPSNYLLFITSVKVLFLVFAVLCLLGVFASLARGKMR